MSVSCGSCHAGRLLSPSVYELHSTIMNDKTIVYGKTNTLKTHEVLLRTSIVSDRVGYFSQHTFPANTPELQDVTPVKNAMYRHEKKSKSMYCKDVEDELVFSTVQGVLARLHVKYAETTIHRVSVNSKEKRMYVELMHTNHRYCVLQQKHHQSNRARAMICLRTKRMYAGCHDKDCCELLKAIASYKKNVVHNKKTAAAEVSKSAATIALEMQNPRFKRAQAIKRNKKRKHDEYTEKYKHLLSREILARMPELHVELTKKELAIFEAL